MRELACGSPPSTSSRSRRTRGRGRSRPAAKRSGSSLPRIAELDLARVESRFHHDLAVVFEGEIDGLVELLRALDLADAHARAEVRRLHEHRQAQGLDDRAHLLALVVRGARGTAPGAGPPGRTAPFMNALSMPAAEAAHAGAHEGHARELEQALDGAVLAERAVEDGEVDVGPRDHGAVRRGGAGRPRSPGLADEEDGRAALVGDAGSVLQQPPAALVHEHGQDVVHARQRPWTTGAGGAHGDLVFARAPAEEQAIVFREVTKPV